MTGKYPAFMTCSGGLSIIVFENSLKYGKFHIRVVM